MKPPVERDEEAELLALLNERQGDVAAAELAKQGTTVFAPGKSAKHPFGVLYQGEWETPWDGTNAAVRLHARALAGQGVPVLLKSFSGSVVNHEGVAESVSIVGVPQAVRDEVNGLNMTSAATLTPAIKHVVVQSAEALTRWILPRGIVHIDPQKMVEMRQAMYANAIVYSVWERDRVDPQIAEQLGRVAQCWVPCEQNADMLRAAGVERVKVVPHPIDPSDMIAKCRNRLASLHQSRRFYTLGRWEPRKGQHNLIGAFLSAFEPGDDVRLTIKYSGGNWPDYPTPAESVRHWLRVFPKWTPKSVQEHITWQTGRVPRSRVVGLHFDNNIYVCSSHGEAWCLPAFDAKLAGNRVVHVPYGGTADFCGPRDVAVPYRMGPVHPSYRWEPDAQWAEYDVGALADCLQVARPPTSFDLDPGFEERFGMDAVGALMAEYALEVADAIEPRAAALYREMMQ